jgi:ketosteroid isomerase-like protein
MFRRTLLAGLAAAAAVPAQDSGTAEVRGAVDKFFAAVKKNDVAAAGRFLADDLIYTHSSGLVETKQQYLDKLKTGEQKYASVDFLKPTFRVYGNTAVLNTQVRMTGTTKNVPFDKTLFLIHVWVKQGGEWKLVAHQTTRKS